MTDQAQIPDPLGPVEPELTIGESTAYTGAEDTESSLSIARLLRRLVDDVAVLMRKELALASSEVSHSVHEAKQGAVSLATGGGVAYAGLLFLLAAATLGLAEVMAAWLAALIVGVVVAVVGLVMVQAGKKRMEPSSFSLDRTAGSVRKDKDMIRRQTS